MMQYHPRYEQNRTSTPNDAYTRPSPTWRLTRRGKIAVFAALAAVDVTLAIVLLGMLFRF